MIALYSKSAGKNAKHAAATESSNISAISNIAVQLFEHLYGSSFRVIPEATASFMTKQFALLPSTRFLCLIRGCVNIPDRLPTFEIGLTDRDIFNSLQAGHAKFTSAMKMFAKRKQSDDYDSE